MKKTFYVTTPIYYASGDPHIGHALSTIYADVLNRYKKILGYETFFVTGMDEHGQKILDVANSKNLQPQMFIDNICKKFKALWESLAIEYSYFVRTSDPKHKETVINVYNKFKLENLIYKGFWESLYSVKSEESIPKSQAIKKDGKLVDQFGHELILKKEESYFFKMNQFQNWITNFLTNNKNFILPHQRINELMNSFINEGIEDLSISRKKMQWGIPVPDDSEQTIYVWIDALFSYLSSLGYLRSDDKLFNKFWQNDDCEIIHIMSKEIMRFHGIYWPIMLNSLNINLPTTIISHGWLIMDNQKMSKSLDNVVNPFDLINRYGRDALRYFLLKEMSLENDINFSEKLLLETYNADLANIYGNLVSRFIGMVHKYNNGVVVKGNEELDSYSKNVVDSAKNLIKQAPSMINSYNIAQLIHEILEFSKKLNKYVEETKPWELSKLNKKQSINTFLFVLANGIRIITVLLQPILVDGTKLISDQMKFQDQQLNFDTLHNCELMNNHTVGNSKPIYLRI